MIAIKLNSRDATYLYAALLLVALSACADSSSQLDMVNNLPIYFGAYDVDKRPLGGPGHQQLFYKLEKPYPSTDVLDFYDRYFKGRDWRDCGGAMDGWQSFIDLADGNKRRVHQIARYFIKVDEEKAGIIYLRYYSSRLNNRSLPDSSTQYVFILMLSRTDVHREFQRLGVDC